MGKFSYLKKSSRSSDGNIFSYDEAVKIAEDSNCDVIHSDTYSLLLDIDNEESYKHYMKTLPLLKGHLPIVEADRWASSSGNLHIVLKSDVPLGELTRLFIQSVFRV